VLHVLPAGQQFDLVERRLVVQEPKIDPDEAAEIAEAGHDLRRMARDIAAADASPSVLRRRIAGISRRRAAAGNATENVETGATE
jgi:cyanophycinase